MLTCLFIFLVYSFSSFSIQTCSRFFEIALSMSTYPFSYGPDSSLHCPLMISSCMCCRPPCLSFCKPALYVLCLLTSQFAFYFLDFEFLGLLQQLLSQLLSVLCPAFGFLTGLFGVKCNIKFHKRHYRLLHISNVSQNFLAGLFPCAKAPSCNFKHFKGCSVT